jgi:hypothetical protein
LFSRNVIDYSQLFGLCKVLRQLVPGLEIMADHEGGPVSQLARAVGRPPAPWGLGVLDDVGLTARVFAATGARLAGAGIDRVLAPVADVLTEIRNPVIGSRSFGTDPDLVARHTVAAVTGLLGAGVKVCLKHWPGHGGSLLDSHLTETGPGDGAVPGPFAGGLTAGADAVMVGHLLTGGAEGPGTLLPATLDPEYVAASRRLLEPGSVGNLRFFADDITMAALGPALVRLGVVVPPPETSGLFDPAALPVAWFEKLVVAGCDRLLIRGLPTGAFPVDTRAVEPAGDPELEQLPDPGFNAGPYAEARLRLGQPALRGFEDPAADLLWLDFSRHDRWEAAGGQDAAAGAAGALEILHGRLEGCFRAVVTADRGEGPGPWQRLLVTSHRPLPDATDFAVNLASRGVCLVMGHPSLAADVAARLGSGWQVGALFDIAPDDLIEGL